MHCIGVTISNSLALSHPVPLQPTLAESERPAECLQQPGELVYVPEGWVRVHRSPRRKYGSSSSVDGPDHLGLWRV